MENRKLNEISISSLLDEEPRQWGLRGDPFLWDEMRIKSKDKILLETEEMMQDYFYKLFYEITGIEITLNRNISLEKYYVGFGMSGGVVCSKFWIKNGIPFILERYKKIKYYLNGIDYQIKDIYWESKYFKGFDNSIECALKRALLFNEVNINYMTELLCIDKNVKKIYFNTKDEILNYLTKFGEDKNVIELISLLKNS
jgi:hypothetical protein